MSELLRSIGTPSDRRGIKGFRDWRFYLAATLLAGSLLCLIHDPYFIVYGEFAYSQGVVVLLLALTVAAAFLWETPIFGKPAGANLLLQSFSIVPFALLMTRLCAADGTSSQAQKAPDFSGFWAAVSEVLYRVLEIIPAWIRELFSNWHIMLLFLVVLGILCWRDVRFRVGAITLILLLLFAIQLGRDSGILNLIAGALLLATALCLMFSRYDKVSYYENILKRLHRSKTFSPEELRSILLVMEKLERKKRLSDEDFRQIVKDCYAADNLLPKGVLDQIAGELARRMIHNHDLVSLRNDSEGIFMFPDPLLYQDDNLLCAVAVVPRLIFVSIFALLWVVLPFDLLPDSLPLVGLIDDMVVMALSGVMIHTTSFPMRKSHE